MLVAGDDGRLGFRHALLREALYDDLLPGERGELHLALARALERQEAEGDEVQRAALIAGHYEAAGDQPSALRASVQAALAARCVHAYGETADLAETCLNEIRPLVEVSSEPQWIGLLGSLLGEVRRRGRDLPGARPTGRSGPRRTWPRRRPACTSRGSSGSSM